jgi:hypothetical protein
MKSGASNIGVGAAPIVCDDLVGGPAVHASFEVVACPQAFPRSFGLWLARATLDIVEDAAVHDEASEDNFEQLGSHVPVLMRK